MTARKRFKRRVRERARKTGESYSAARQHLERRLEQEPNMTDATPTPTSFTSAQGLQMQLPPGWREAPANRWESPLRVTGFVDANNPSIRTAEVMVNPAGRSLAEIVEAIRAGYERVATSVAVSPSIVGGVTAFRIDGQSRRGGRDWVVAEHVVVHADRVFRIALGSDNPERDRRDQEAIMASVRLTEPTAAVPSPVPDPLLTDRSRQAIVLANVAADELGHSHMSVEHLLYGLLAVGSGVAADVLNEFGLTAQTLRPRLSTQTDGQPATGTISVTDELALLLEETAPDRARQMGQYYVGTEHLLLALLYRDNPARRLVEAAGLTPADIRDRVGSLLASNLEASTTAVE